LPRLQTLREQFSPDALEVLAINRQDPVDDVRRLVQESGFTVRVGVDGEGSGVTARYDVKFYPATFVLDGAGTVTTVIVGQDEAKLRAALAEAGVSRP
jgi:hypothetical protein